MKHYISAGSAKDVDDIYRVTQEDSSFDVKMSKGWLKFMLVHRLIYYVLVFRRDEDDKFLGFIVINASDALHGRLDVSEFFICQEARTDWSVGYGMKAFLFKVIKNTGARQVYIQVREQYKAWQQRIEYESEFKRIAILPDFFGQGENALLYVWNTGSIGGPQQ